MTSIKAMAFAMVLFLVAAAAFLAMSSLYEPAASLQDNDDVVVSKYRSATDALNSCFDEKTPTTCGAEARQFMASVQRARARKLVKPIEAEHDVYFIRFGSLTFWKPNCSEADIGHDVYVVNIFPQSLENIPKERRAGGYDVIGFNSATRSIKIGTDCIASQRLPNYTLNKLVVGQFNRSGDQKGFVWSKTIHAWR